MDRTPGALAAGLPIVGSGPVGMTRSPAISFGEASISSLSTIAQSDALMPVIRRIRLNQTRDVDPINAGGTGDLFFEPFLASACNFVR